MVKGNKRKFDMSSLIQLQAYWTALLPLTRVRVPRGEHGDWPRLEKELERLSDIE
jgi:hypothetical protein